MPPSLPHENSWLKENWIVLVVVPVGLLMICSILFLRVFIIQAYRIPSGAMSPTLIANDYILVDKTYSFENIERQDIIIFRFPKDIRKDFVMRVVGVPGDIIEIKDKVFFLNHNQQKENYIMNYDSKNISQRDNFGPAIIPENSVFVMGDNRDNSYDSRFWGFVDSNKIKAKAKIIYWSRDKNTGDIRWNRIGKTTI